jgi:transcriptional/translational regulatory protein YebC/TACO1
MIPSSSIKVTSINDAKQILSLIESLEEHDDIQHLYSNFDIPDEILEKSSVS